MREHVYKLRRAQTNANNRPDRAVWVLTVPREIGEALSGRFFKFTMTEDGLLYIPVPDEADVEMPSWARKED